MFTNLGQDKDAWLKNSTAQAMYAPPMAGNSVGPPASADQAVKFPPGVNFPPGAGLGPPSPVSGVALPPSVPQQSGLAPPVGVQQNSLMPPASGNGYPTPPVAQTAPSGYPAPAAQPQSIASGYPAPVAAQPQSIASGYPAPVAAQPQAISGYPAPVAAQPPQPTAYSPHTAALAAQSGFPSAYTSDAAAQNLFSQSSYQSYDSPAASGSGNAGSFSDVNNFTVGASPVSPAQRAGWMGMLDQAHFMVSNLLMGDASGSTPLQEQHEPRFVYSQEHGRWINETWDAATGTWVPEDAAAADAREANLTKGYTQSAPVAASAPPPMANTPPPAANAPPPGGYFPGGNIGTPTSRYVDVMQQRQC